MQRYYFISFARNFKKLIKHAKILYNKFWQHRVTEKAFLKKVPQICAYVDPTSSKTKYYTSNVCLLFKFSPYNNLLLILSKFNSASNI